MKVPRLALAILLVLILALIFCDFSNSGTDLGRDKGGSQANSIRNFAESQREKKHGVTPSERKLVTVENFDSFVFSLNVEDGESVFLRGRELDTNVSEIIYLSGELVVLDDGKEVLRLLRKVIHTWNGDVQKEGEGDFFEEDEDEWVVDEKARQTKFRRLAQTKGTNIMTMETKLVGLGEAFEAVVARGEDELCIEGVAQRGRDGELRLRLGDFYARPGDE